MAEHANITRRAAFASIDEEGTDPRGEFLRLWFSAPAWQQDLALALLDALESEGKSQRSASCAAELLEQPLH